MNKVVRDRLAHLKGQVRSAREAQADLDPNYLIKGWLMGGATSVIYGPSNVGKTFLALKIAQAVASGTDWFGCKTRRQHVLYAAAEGGRAFENRVAALRAAEFDWITHPFDFHANAIDAQVLAHLYNEMNPNPAPGLIIIDTLARVMAAGDENSSVDMGLLIRNVDTLARMTGAHVMLIHHTGKDTALGARGHSSLRAAIDTEIELSRDEESGVISVMSRKQRDIGMGRDAYYSLAEVHLGTDPDGDAVTTCIVAEAEAQEPVVKDKRRPLKGHQQVAHQALLDALRDHGQKRSGPDFPGKPVVHVDHWREACKLHGLLNNPKSKDGGRNAYKRAKEWLMNSDYVRSYQDYWWVC
ncbi:helicase RepA family protein [Sedimentitalea sp. JM2-8]|uniref:Helicase RepA family protein n=1 Tax=Sedimentitalea xiamensis TaxID=3050037 RepID=A0ABT7FJX2_9RHOB|nr:helicase RepA family protein [Sedimentitalea xiamensis]MDK3075443.1 helicase RepA family protein [Sedimentitalea xiamensis]